MANAAIWISIVISIIIPFVGWIFRNLISRDIEDIREKQKEDHDLFFKRLDAVKEEYVRKELYDQAVTFRSEAIDEKFKSMLAIMNTQFANIEGKMDELKDLVIDRINHKNGGQL